MAAAGGGDAGDGDGGRPATKRHKKKNKGGNVRRATAARAGRDYWRRWLVHQSVAVLIACAPDSLYPTGDDVETLTWRHKMLYVE